MHTTGDHDTTRLYTTAEVAQLLGVIPRRVRQLAAQLDRGRMIGDRLVFDRADIAAFRQRRTKRGPKPRKAAGDAR